MTDLQRVIDTIAELPTLPDVVMRINRLVSDRKTSASDINNVISQDIALASKILKVVNSPFYGFPRRITSITYAVVILGFRAVRNLALSACIFDTFRGKSAARDFDLPALWDHSIGTALASAALADHAEVEISADDAFMGGLLHDVGKVTMSQFLAEDLRAVVERVREADCLFYDAETETLTYHHADVGALLLERWNLPQPIVEVARHHHRPATAPPEAAPLAAVVHTADIVTRSLLCGNGGDRRIPRLDPDTFATLGLTWEAMESVMKKVAQDARQIDSFYALA